MLFLGSGLDVDTKGVLAAFDLFEERSIGTWVNAALLAAVALVAAAVATATPWGATRIRRGWVALAMIAGLASLDEVAGFHESAVGAVRSAVSLPGFLFYAAWVLPALALVAAFVVWQWRFFRLLPRALSTRVALAAGVYVAAAGGLEILESQMLASTGGRDWTPVLQVIVGLEEGVEMGAAAVMLLALLRHLAKSCPEWKLSVSVVDSARRRDSGERVALAPVVTGAVAAEPRWAREVTAERMRA